MLTKHEETVLHDLAALLNEARAAVQNLIRTRHAQDRLIDVDTIYDCINEAVGETAS